MRQISRYRGLEKLGAGGMGDVFLAGDVRLNRGVALKLLPSDCVADPDRLARFQQEALAASSLNHPNTYQPLRNSAVRESILRMAHATGIGADEVWEMDASRQTTRISANVSGMLGTERITLNDGLLNRASPAAIEAVMGHEIGHDVLNHVYEMLAYFAVIIAAGFALTGWTFGRLSARYRSRWHVSGIADPAGVPRQEAR
jgi:Zn-dependent protease with chaperone function